MTAYGNGAQEKAGNSRAAYGNGAQEKTEISRAAYFQAEKMKFRHSVLPKVVVGMPLLCILAAVLLTYSYFIIDSYNWWYMFLCPGTAALLSGSIYMKDKKQKGRTLYCLPVDMGKVWDAKVANGICYLGIASAILAAGVFFLRAVLKNIFSVPLQCEPPVAAQAAAVVLLWLSFLWQVPFCQLLTRFVGLFPMIFLHMAGYVVLSASLSVTSFYLAVPQGITARMMCAVLGVLPNGLPAEPGQMTFSVELLDMSSVWLGVPVSLLWFLAFWYLGRKCEKMFRKGA